MVQDFVRDLGEALKSKKMFIAAPERCATQKPLPQLLKQRLIFWSRATQLEAAPFQNKTEAEYEAASFFADR